MELHIDGQHTEVSTDLQSWITERVEALNTPHDDIVHARVTVEKHERHAHGSDEARVFLTLSGKNITAARTGKTLEDALYTVFDVIDRELRDFRLIRRGVVKEHSPQVRGRIVRLFPDRGYGFIETETQREVYFHANAVHGVPFDKLAVNTAVDLDIEAGEKGPQATRVTPRWP
jgi:cold shock CspA family protein/ribosome-associated translation inhibitor RaiA